VGAKSSLWPKIQVESASPAEARDSGAMSLDSEASSQGGDYRSFRQITRDRNPSSHPDFDLLARCLAAAGNGSGKVARGAGNTGMRFVALECRPLLSVYTA
jgi:hypothetical protein